MTGWRIGFAVGNKDIIAGLARVKSNLDSGIFQAIQVAGIAALTGPQTFRKELMKMYQERRDILISGLDALGWHVRKPKATFYVWINVPPGFTSAELARLLLEKANIISTPGNGFGMCGEGYIRMTLTKGKERLEEAVHRIKKMHDEWR
jgi:LL-diaminopimelate aminotransferase